jgi:hypothetical protein
MQEKNGRARGFNGKKLFDPECKSDPFEKCSRKSFPGEDGVGIAYDKVFMTSRRGPGIFSLTYISARDKTLEAALATTDPAGKSRMELEPCIKIGQKLGRGVGVDKCNRMQKK